MLLLPSIVSSRQWSYQMFQLVPVPLIVTFPPRPAMFLALHLMSWFPQPPSAPGPTSLLLLPFLALLPFLTLLRRPR